MGEDVYNMEDRPQYLHNEIVELRNLEGWIETLLGFDFETVYLASDTSASELISYDLSKKRLVNARLFKLYPECVLNQGHKLTVEFRYLLPKTPKVEEILPVLLVGYITQRRGTSSCGPKGRCREQISEKRSTENLLFNLLNHGNDSGNSYIITYYKKKCSR